MRPVTFPLDAELVGIASPLPVTRIAKCAADRGRVKCGREFVQTLTNADGSPETAKQSRDGNAWIPDFCAVCSRVFNRTGR